MIIYADPDSPTRIDDAYDPDEKKFYVLNFRPKTRQDSYEYIEGVDVVIPSTPNGFIYECLSGGRSASSAPSFVAKKDAKTQDGTVIWKAVPYQLTLNTGDTITASSWSGTNGAVLDNDAIVDNIQTKVRLTGVTSGVTETQLTNHITVLRVNGDEEEIDKTIIIKVKSK